MKYLVVDDNDILREALEAILEDAGHSVDVARNGNEALKMAVHSPPDVVISDILMPEMDGFMLCRKIKEDATLHNIPIIFYTGSYLEPEHEKLAIALGASAYLKKPMKPDQLLQAIEKAISKYQSHKLPLPTAPIGDTDSLTKMHEDILVQKLAEQVKRLEKEINERNQAEGKASELNKILEESLNEIYAFDAKNLKFIHVNHGARVNLGYELDELISLTPVDIKPEFTKTSFKKLIKPLMVGKEKKLQFTTVHRRKNGSLYPVEVNLQLSSLESRKVFVAIILDITKRKRAEMALQEEQQVIRQVIDTARDCFVRMDLDGVTTDWNPQAVEVFGWSREEACGQPMDKLIIPPEYRKAHKKGLKYFLTTGKSSILNRDVEITAQHRDGHMIPVELSIVPVQMGGSVSFNAFIRDISIWQKAKKDLKASLVGTIVAVSKAVEARDPYTSGHQQRVARLARCIAQEMGLDAAQVDGLRMGATIHDIGKIYLPAEILSKPTKLTDTEFELIKSHCQVGYDILKDVEFPWPIADIVCQHHERLDGTGYPQGLKGDEICLEARIVAVADVVEAISSHRPYRPSLGMDVALEEITTHRGKWFEPAAVDACLKLIRKKEFSFDDSRPKHIKNPPLTAIQNQLT
ncbi:MAG: PAS domain S-box protein [Mariprofundaceae bacterium]